jgi:hypothetical protein
MNLLGKLMLIGVALMALFAALISDLVWAQTSTTTFT